MNAAKEKGVGAPGGARVTLAGKSHSGTLSPALDPVLARRDVWRGREPHATTPTVASGRRVLDAALPGGGWPLGALTEICSAQAGLGELSLMLPALVRLAAPDRWLGFVAPPYPLYAPALAQAGLPLARCLVVTHHGGDLPGDVGRAELLGVGHDVRRRGAAERRAAVGEGSAGRVLDARPRARVRPRRGRRP